MTHSRYAALKRMLEERGRAIDEQIQSKVRGFREAGPATVERPLEEEGDAHGDIDFAVVQLQSQTASDIRAALSRLEAGDYGICHDCGEEILEKRLRAMPFATRCRDCQELAERAEIRDRRARNLDVRGLGFLEAFGG